MPHEGTNCNVVVAALCCFVFCALLVVRSVADDGTDAPMGSLKARLVSYWSFDGSGDSIFYDAAGGNHATASGGASRIASDRSQGAVLGLSQDGSSAVIAEPSGVDFDRSDAFSFSGWVRLADDPKLLNFPPADIVHRLDKDNSNRGFDLALAHGKVVLGVIHTPANAIQVMSQQPLALGAWHHVVVTYDGSSRAEGVRIYIDGKRVKTDALMDNLTASTRPAGPLVIGTWYYEPWSTHMQFRGQLDDLAIWKGVLDERQIGLLYRSGAVHVLSEPALDAVFIAVIALACVVWGVTSRSRIRGLDLARAA